MKFWALTIFFATLGLCAEVAADTAYVIDKLLVGVHETPDLNSAIVKVLPTGTKLDVARRDGELALVTDPDGTRGWVDAAYLMDEAPAEVRVQSLTAENKRLLAELSNAGGAAPNLPTGEQRDALTKENTDLKGKLSAEKMKTGELQSQVSTLESKVASRSTTPADSIIAELEAKNQELDDQLEQTIEAKSKLASKLNEASEIAIPRAAANSLSTPVLAGLLVLILAAFAAGVYVMDYFNRRRHGGFRI